MISSPDRILKSLDPDEICELALALCRIPSPTGEEGELGGFVVDWFRRHDLIAIRQEVEAGRANAIGIVRGRRDGPALMLTGHMDNGATFRHEELSGPIPPRRPILEPCIKDGILYGTGMDNMKSGLAAIMCAAKAVMESGALLQGDLIVAGVVGEVSCAPVDQYQGHYYRSQGIGTRYLLSHGILCDYAIVADTSHFGLTWAQCGAVYAKITVQGRRVHTPFTVRAAAPRESNNAIVKMHVFLDAVERWAAEYERKNIYRFAGGEIQPKVNVGAIAGGVPFKVGYSPLSCSIYVDIRTPPGKRPREVQRELRAMLDAVGLEYELEIFSSQMGHEGKGVEPLVKAIRRAHETVVGKPPPPIDPAENGMWTDTNVFNELGIPAVKFGIGAALRPSAESELHGMARVPNSTSVEDLINATKIYALASLSLCGVMES